MLTTAARCLVAIASAAGPQDSLWQLLILAIIERICRWRDPGWPGPLALQRPGWQNRSIEPGSRLAVQARAARGR